MEPTPNDVAAVAATLNQQPAPEPAQQPTQTPPAPQQPAPQAPSEPAPTQAPQPAPQTPTEPGAPTVTPQPAPSQQPQDPFATLMASEPQTPPAQPPQEPAQPAEPETPPAQQPTQQTQPTQQQTQPTQTQQPATQSDDDYQTFEEYINQALGNVEKAPDLPDAGKIDPNDPTAIKGFFDNLVNVAVARATNQYKKSQAIQESERKLWDSAFDKYGSLRTNRKARDLVHNIRMGYFQKGKAITPTQAADILLDSMGQQYRKGMADNQVHTTIEQVQPTAGGGTPVSTTADRQKILKDVQEGGETALASYLDEEVKAGRL